jgi:small subunit ribosomal protein S3
MGQKIHPKGFRIGPVFTWVSRWFADDKRYKELLLEDVELRKFLSKRLKTAGVEEVEIDRSINKIKLTLHVSRPGMVIGRGGSGLEELKKAIEQFLAKFRKLRSLNRQHGALLEGTKSKVELTVEPVKEPNLSAYLVATSIADQLARRLPTKRVCNQTIERVMNAGARGVKIGLSGRINGAEIARREKFGRGTVPLSTIREEIDFASVPSLTKSGYIGVKVWICKKG